MVELHLAFDLVTLAWVYLGLGGFTLLLGLPTLDRGRRTHLKDAGPIGIVFVLALTAVSVVVFWPWFIGEFRLGLGDA